MENMSKEHLRMTTPCPFCGRHGCLGFVVRTFDSPPWSLRDFSFFVGLKADLKHLAFQEGAIIHVLHSCFGSSGERGGVVDSEA